MDRSDRLGTRVRPMDKNRWRKAAKASGMSMSAWVESCLNVAASNVLDQSEQPVAGDATLIRANQSDVD